MLSRIRIMNTDGHTNREVNVWLNESPSSGYFLKEVEGLDPVDAQISATDYAIQHGSIFHNSKKTTRDVLITIGFEPDWANGQTVSELIRHLHLVAGTSKNVRIDLMEGSSRVMYIRGYVETFMPSRLDQDPSVGISIHCVEPDWLGNTATNIVTGTSGDGQPLQVPYSGTEDTGFTTRIYANSTVNYVELRDQVMDNNFRVTTPVTAGQYVSIVSSANTRRVDLRNRSNGSLIRRVISGIQPGAEWPTLRYGTNIFSAHPATSTAMDVEIRYQERFSGYA